MLNTIALGALAIAGASAHPQAGSGNDNAKRSVATTPEPAAYTATDAADVYAAQATGSVPTSHDTSYVPGRSFDRFVTIWLENTDFAKAEGDPNMAWLASKGITLTNYFGVTHPSEPNYVASIGGDNFGMDNDNFNNVPANVSSVIDLLEAAGVSWSSYEEDMPYTGFEGYAWVNQSTKANDYVRKHNPPVIYNANTTPQRLSYQKNLTEFHKDLAAETLPQWMFITPNMTDDGHDTSVTVAGNWTRSFLEPLLSNEYFMRNTLVLITFDENHTYTLANRVFSILLGGVVDDAGLVNTTDDHFYDHYSEISTVEANWDLHTLGRWDVGANVFDMVAKTTGDIYTPWDAVTGTSPSVFLNASYAGPFNEDFAQAPFPIPNVHAVSPVTFRTVAPAIQAIWGKVNGTSIYNNSVTIPDGMHPPAGYAVN